MKSNEILYKVTGDDEAYTPAYGVRPILKYITRIARQKGNLIVWCPFDTKASEFVKLISELKNINVIYSHITDGKDFFNYEPPKWDIIVSNPPFKNKRLFFERALSFNKPFALLMTNTWLNDKYSKQVFINANKQLQLLMFTKRIKFDNPYGKANKHPTFSSSYYCVDFLPKDLILEEM